MALTTAEKNRRKRERKKREREEQRKREEEEKSRKGNAGANKIDEEEDIEIEYVVESVFPVDESLQQQEKSSAPSDSQSDNKSQDGTMENILKRFQERAAIVVVSDDEKSQLRSSSGMRGDDDGDDSDVDDVEDGGKQLSKRKLRELSRPSVAELKRRVNRADLVEAHDVTAANPDFLILLKGVPGTVPVPRHWGRKRKYLQGKRGIEKKPFQLPDFIVKTGICEIRDTVAEDEAKQSAKQKNRARVAPKLGGIDVDYRTLHDAFFKYQTKPSSLTAFGDLYYEGKEMETRRDLKPGQLSSKLRDALGMTDETSPPPYLINMQRYGPPPSYPNLKIPGLNAPLPAERCQYGYHPGGWGKPPVDPFGRPLYGGNPFGKPGGGDGDDDNTGLHGLVTSDGKTIEKTAWGALPTGDYEVEEEAEESSEEESSDEEMESEGEEKEEEHEEEEETPVVQGQLPSAGALDLRKQAGDETPFDAAPKQLYTVLEQKQADTEEQKGAVFSSDVAYVVPGATAAVPEGAESVLSKAIPANESGKRKKRPDEDDEADDLGKKFKF